MSTAESPFDIWDFEGWALAQVQHHRHLAAFADPLDRYRTTSAAESHADVAELWSKIHRRIVDRDSIGLYGLVEIHMQQYLKLEDESVLLFDAATFSNEGVTSVGVWHRIEGIRYRGIFIPAKAVAVEPADPINNEGEVEGSDPDHDRQAMVLEAELGELLEWPARASNHRIDRLLAIAQRGKLAEEKLVNVLKQLGWTGALHSNEYPLESIDKVAADLIRQPVRNANHYWQVSDDVLVMLRSGEALHPWLNDKSVAARVVIEVDPQKGDVWLVKDARGQTSPFSLRMLIREREQLYDDAVILHQIAAEIEGSDEVPTEPMPDNPALRTGPLGVITRARALVGFLRRTANAIAEVPCSPEWAATEADRKAKADRRRELMKWDAPQSTSEYKRGRDHERLDVLDFLRYPPGSLPEHWKTCVSELLEALKAGRHVGSAKRIYDTTGIDDGPAESIVKPVTE
ncbi:MAG: hypothetical protein M0R28_18065 [Pigmentiphaga sp.]|nr:hypothetical protein [Pigmentiphaga sp.]